MTARCYRHGERVSKKTKGASRLLLWQVCSRRLPSKPTSYKCDSGLTATRRFGKDPQRVSGFRPAPLLKLVNPIGHGLNHIARCFTSGICLCLNDWARFFALLYYANCFLLRHCYFRVSVVLNVSNEFPATQFRNFHELRTIAAFTPAKKGPHPLTRRLREKRATSRKKFFPGKTICVLYG